MKQAVTEKREAERLQSLMNKCRHFSGIYGNACCKAGVRYDVVKIDHAPVPYVRRGVTYHRNRSWPCFADEPEAQGRCAKASFLSEEEARVIAEKREREAAISLEGVARCMVASKDVKGGTGVVECPKCGGKLHWSKAETNGHVWGRCETADCLAWAM